tara:strand:+ start:1373 stop:2221 length:849 start_codon:yes stop_codon:yes gene_type:complete
MLEIKNPAEHLKQYLESYGLTNEQRKTKGTYIGGSTAKMIWEGDWVTAYQRIKGESEDLSHVFKVQLGNVTEHFNLAWSAVLNDWTSYKIPKEVIRHPEHKHIGALVDAIATDDKGKFIVDAKHTAGFSKWWDIDNIIEQYYWQGINNMLATGIHRFALTVIDGTNINHQVFIEYSDDNAAAYLEKANEFWTYIALEIEPPNSWAEDPPDEIRGELKSYDFNQNNAWASAAHDYLKIQSQDAALKAAKSALKDLVPDDARKVIGHGVTASRNVKGVVSVRAA